MNRLNFYYSHLNSAAQILQLYDGEIPFAYFIKNYFSQNRKFGSKDRRRIEQLCYAFFRLGKSFMNLPIKERILTGLKNIPEPVDPAWSTIMEECELPLEKPQHIFPFKDELSETIDAVAFEASFAVQPDLFLRIRTGQKNNVLKKLENAGVQFSGGENFVTLSNATKLADILLMNKEVVVQDISSQKISSFLEDVKNSFAQHRKISVYDCCAASGGKSILAKDVLENINLTVSDIRPSIIANLEKRFEQAGILDYKAFVADVSKPGFAMKQQFDLVIADVPCTGSGTWARTPEQLYFFTREKIIEYAKLQKDILKNTLNLVKPGGFLLYITCSVFAAENELQVSKIANEAFQVKLMQTLCGYDKKADTMFGCLLQKRL